MEGDVVRARPRLVGTDPSEDTERAAEQCVAADEARLEWSLAAERSVGRTYRVGGRVTRRVPDRKPRLRLSVSAAKRIVFASSSLPRTMELVDLVSPLLDKHVATPHDWPIHDRVLVWLAPHFQPRAEAFHDGRGQRLDRCHGENLMKHLDDELFIKLAGNVDRLLAKELARLMPAPTPVRPPKGDPK